MSVKDVTYHKPPTPEQQTAAARTLARLARRAGATGDDLRGALEALGLRAYVSGERPRKDRA